MRIKQLKKNKEGVLNEIYVALFVLLFLTFYAFIIGGFAPLLMGTNYNNGSHYDELKDSFSTSDMQNKIFFGVDGTQNVKANASDFPVLNTLKGASFIHSITGNGRLFTNLNDGNDKYTVFLVRNQTRLGVNFEVGYYNFYLIEKSWGIFSWKYYVIPFYNTEADFQEVGGHYISYADFSIEANMNNSFSTPIRTDISLTFDKPIVLSFSFENKSNWRNELYTNSNYSVFISVDKAIELADQSNMWSVLGKILTFSLPNIDPNIQILMAVPFYGGMAIDAYILITRLIP